MCPDGCKSTELRDTAQYTFYENKLSGKFVSRYRTFRRHLSPDLRSSLTANTTKQPQKGPRLLIRSDDEPHSIGSDGESCNSCMSKWQGSEELRAAAHAINYIAGNMKNKNEASVISKMLIVSKLNNLTS
ncbi:unnamed protein product [Clavelina lepadiformis]|uniref:Uncharacterized protein n=1 Tax=Clavelina lepadiformis TaxID=159417 RepID=A0ABP0H4P1_CLALP